MSSSQQSHSLLRSQLFSTFFVPSLLPPCTYALSIVARLPHITLLTSMFTGGWLPSSPQVWAHPIKISFSGQAKVHVTLSTYWTFVFVLLFHCDIGHRHDWTSGGNSLPPNITEYICEPPDTKTLTYDLGLSNQIHPCEALSFPGFGAGGGEKRSLSWCRSGFSANSKSALALSADKSVLALSIWWQ